MGAELRTRGFTLVEVLVATVILSVVLLGLHRVYLQQRQISGWQRDMAVANDVFRIVGSVLSDDLREAIAAEGDVALAAVDSMRVRSPIGFAYACYTDADEGILGLEGITGSLPSAPGDSLHLYATGGWRRATVTGTVSRATGRMRCANTRLRPARLVRLPEEDLDGVPVGAPLRTFRSTSYHTTSFEGEVWFARSDASGTEAIAGPISPGGLRFRTLDVDGAETADPSATVAVEVMVAVPRPATGGSVVDTMVMVFQGRNR